jgi:hypothetical protein
VEEENKKKNETEIKIVSVVSEINSGYFERAFI